LHGQVAGNIPLLPEGPVRIISRQRRLPDAERIGCFAGEAGRWRLRPKAGSVLDMTSAPSTLDQVFIALPWLAFYAQWLTVVPTIVPRQVATILGSNGAVKEGVSGTILAAGALVALVISPLAGALSDRRRAPGVRRRPFLVLGVLCSSVALASMVPFGRGSSLLLYALAFLNLQFWWNWAAGPYAGLIPDLVPEGARSTASAWMNVMSVLGAIVGNLALVPLFRPERPAAALATLAAIGLVVLALTLARVRERPVAGPTPPFDMIEFLGSFWLSPRQHSNFYWVLATRLFVNMGVWSIFAFLMFYLSDVIGVAAPEKVLPALLGAGAAVAIPASLLGARLADRFGIVALVRATSWIMAVAAACYVLIAFAPSLVLVAPVIVIFSAASGAYQAVDWALALAVLPSPARAGKDMGIWHISMVLPQIVGPATTGWLISWLSQAASGPFAYTVAFGIAALWFLLAAAFVGHIRLAEPG
jgi:MFS family permease